MRSLAKNEVEMWYALFKGVTHITDENGDETGDPVEKYYEPVKFKAVPSVGSGKVEMRVFGADITFSRSIVTTDLNLPVDVSSLIWIEHEPKYLEDGSVDPFSADYTVSGKPRVSYNFLMIPLSERVKNA